MSFKQMGVVVRKGALPGLIAAMFAHGFFLGGLNTWINRYVGVTLGSALGYEMRVDLIIPALMGVVFVAVGNYLPKCQPNRYMGIKLPWTFASEENWRKTHRFGGFVWVVSGILIILSAIINWPWVQLVALFASILLPTIYSWNYARKEK